jgi:hypothetical protein
MSWVEFERHVNQGTEKDRNSFTRQRTVLTQNLVCVDLRTDTNSTLNIWVGVDGGGSTGSSRRLFCTPWGLLDTLSHLYDLYFQTRNTISLGAVCKQLTIVTARSVPPHNATQRLASQPSPAQPDQYAACPAPFVQRSIHRPRQNRVHCALTCPT